MVSARLQGVAAGRYQSYLLRIFRALRESSVVGCWILGVPGAEYPAALLLQTDGCLYLSQPVGEGKHVGQMALASSRGQGIDTLPNRNSWWGVSDTSRLGFVVTGREEVVLQVFKARVGLLYEGDPTIPPGLGQLLLGDGDQAGVLSVANGAFDQLRSSRDRAEQNKGACNVGDLFWMVDADAAAEEEVNDSLDWYVSAFALHMLPFW